MARKDQIKKIQHLLVTRRNALRTALAGDLSLLEQQSGGDVVDWAIDSAQDELSSQLAEVESRELSSIEVALERIREGTYGLCDACEKKIPLARLQAIPYATLCIGCQQAAEQGRRTGNQSADWGRVNDSDSDADLTLDDVEMEYGSV